MRTTVELSRHQARAIELSVIAGVLDADTSAVEVAVRELLSRRTIDTRDARTAALMSFVGAVPDDAAEHMHATVRRLRTSW